MSILAKCNSCGFETDVKTKARLYLIKKESYRCKQCIILEKTRICGKCNRKIMYPGPAAKKKADVKHSICKQCRTNQIPEKLTQEQEEFLTGLMLGDGSIVYSVKNKSLYPRLTIRRQAQDKKYLNWQYEVFKEFYSSPPKYMEIYDKRTKKTYISYNLQSKSGKIYKQYHIEWYPYGKKIIPKTIKLTPLTLLIWFLDDGCVVHSGKNSLTIKISTNCFVKEDVEFLSQLLTKNFGIKLNVYKHDSGYILKGATGPALKFIDTIKDIFPDFMQRKKTWTINE